MVKCFNDVDVGYPCEATLVATALLIRQHCDEDVVGMDLGGFDVARVCQAAEDVLGVMLRVDWWEDLFCRWW